MRRLVLAASLALIAPLALAINGAAAQPKMGTSTLQLDSDHSNVTATVGGAKSRFMIVAGALQYDPAKPEQSTIALSLDTSSIASDAVRRAFDSDHFPELRISSTGPARPGSGGSEALPAAITIRDITRPVVFQVSLKKTSAQVITIHAEATVHSADFKLNGKGDVPIVIDGPFVKLDPTTPLP